MPFTEDILIDGREFSYLSKISVPLNEKVEPLYLSMQDADEEKVDPEILKTQRKIIRILLNEFVVRPKITDDIIDDPEHDLQPYLFDLGNELFMIYSQKYADHMERVNEVKKRLSGSDALKPAHRAGDGDEIIQNT
jgi:hypothetical protein